MKKIVTIVAVLSLLLVVACNDSKEDTPVKETTTEEVTE